MKISVLLLILLVSGSCFASCLGHDADSIGNYHNMSSIYRTAVVATESVSIGDGRAKIIIRLKVLETLKGKERDYLVGEHSVPFPFLHNGEWMEMELSVDVNYYIGQSVNIILYDDSEQFLFGSCSRNITSHERMNLLEQHIQKINNNEKLENNYDMSTDFQSLEEPEDSPWMPPSDN